VSPAFFDPHVCSRPSTADLIGREMDFGCRCGRRWRLEHSLGKDRRAPGTVVGLALVPFARPHWNPMSAARQAPGATAVGVVPGQSGPTSSASGPGGRRPDPNRGA
jgi:hypothetical protein